jgi:hypothetical protein
MQKMGGGKYRGGGNDPTCGCDMQAGWPSASTFPRGGLQGGGNWNFNEFNLALTKNGKTRHLKGKWNNMNTVEANADEEENISLNTNMKRNKTNKKRASSAPNGYSNLAFKGKKYYKKTNSGEVFEATTNGTLGKSMGFYVTPKSGKPYLTQMPPRLENEGTEPPEVNLNRTEPVTPPKKTQGKAETELPPALENNNAEEEDEENSSPEPETEGMDEENESQKSLSMKGGRRHRKTRKTKHKKRHGKKKTHRRKH